jgi:hypothetical protein
MHAAVLKMGEEIRARYAKIFRVEGRYLSARARPREKSRMP